MAWMALGGTTKRIPQDIIQLVAATRIMGVARPGLSFIPGARDRDGQHAEPGQGPVYGVLPSPTDQSADGERCCPPFELHGDQREPPRSTRPTTPGTRTSSTTNYDKEMWVHLCSDFSPRVIRVYGWTRPADPAGPPIELVAMYYAQDQTDQTKPGYPADMPVWGSEETADGVYARELLIRPASIRA